MRTVLVTNATQYAGPGTVEVLAAAGVRIVCHDASFGVQVNVVAPNYLYGEMYYPRARFIDDEAGRVYFTGGWP
jgi:3-oxoacyl-[acyl-carrier protein] reductase